MNQNQDFRFLHYPLPPDVVRLRESGDLKGAIRLIDKALIGDTHPELAARLRVERERLFRLPAVTKMETCEKKRNDNLISMIWQLDFFMVSGYFLALVFSLLAVL